jgi:glycosyltransferase involved in cell wall biosynthesis
VTTSPPSAGLFRDHPIPPVQVKDPLALLDEIRSQPDTTSDSARPHIGFACLWEPNPRRTWSGSAWNLREALRLVAETTDLGVQIPPMSRTILKAIHTRYRAGRLTTTWNYSRLTDAYNTSALRRELTRNFAARRCDAVLMIDDLAALPIPFFTYYDMSWDGVISTTDTADAYAALRQITPSTMERRRERQLAVYERATGIVAMSHWLARSLVEQSGVSPAKVHVVHPGVSAGWAPQNGQFDVNSGVAQSERNVPHPLRERPAPRRRLLFVGRQYKEIDFYRKGGDLVVAALALLRRDYDPNITLTVAGMEAWPLPGNVPDGVHFRGILPPDEVTALYDTHDLFVMPSRMEPFGIVFAEALSRGLPCIARDAYAMPEMVTPGISGALITKDDEHELAAVVAAVLTDDALYEACRRRASRMAAYFSWERAAIEMVQVMTPCQQGLS